jgi:hypothetical protein
MRYPKPSSGNVSKPSKMVNVRGNEIPAEAIQFLDNVAMVDAFGQLIVEEIKSNVSVNFADGRLDTNFDVKEPILSGDGAATASAGYAQVSSTTGSACVESRDSLRYINGRGFVNFFTAYFDGDGVGWAGGFDGETLHDGFPIRYDGTQKKLEFGYLREGVFTSAVEVDMTDLNIKPNKMNIFAVMGGFLGVANPTLLVRKGTWQAAAVIETEGNLEGTHVRLPAFPLSIRSEGNMTVRAGSWHAGTAGDAGKVQDRGFSYPNQPFGLVAGENPPTAPRGRLTLSGNTVSTLFTLRSKDTYNGLPNKVKADIIDLNVTVEPTATSGVVQVQIIGNPTIAGSAYSDISESSVLEIDDNENGPASGAYIPGTSGGVLIGKPINIIYAGSGGQRVQGGEGEILVDELSLDGIAGETLAVIARDLDGNNVTIDWSLTWIERQI